MKIKVLFVTVLAVLGAGCASATFSKTGDYTAEPRPSDCDFAVYTIQPSYTVKEIGLIDFSAAGPDAAKKRTHKIVCDAGGNGLILSGYTQKFGYTKGTVVWVQK